MVITIMASFVKKKQQNFHIDTYTSMKLEQLRILATFLQGL